MKAIQKTLVLAVFSLSVVSWALAQDRGLEVAQLEAVGTVLSPLDLLIASHALSLHLTLVTNDGAFSLVPGLAVEDWSRDVPD